MPTQAFHLRSALPGHASPTAASLPVIKIQGYHKQLSSSKVVHREERSAYGAVASPEYNAKIAVRAEGLSRACGMNDHLIYHRGTSARLDEPRWQIPNTPTKTPSTTRARATKSRCLLGAIRSEESAEKTRLRVNLQKSSSRE
jgi:hypothetical protein